VREGEQGRNDVTRGFEKVGGGVGKGAVSESGLRRP